MRFLLLMFLLVPVHAPASEVITRATANLNGVTSPRGFFNLTVRLYQLRGVEWAKYDLKKSMITMDFEPGVAVTSEEIGKVMSSAGYKPGLVHVEQVQKPEQYEHRLGWNKIKRPTVKNPIGRWFQVNF